LIDRQEIWHDNAVWTSWTFRQLKLWQFIYPRWRRQPS